MFSFIQNVIEIFAWCLVLLYKMVDQNPIFFGIVGELNTPLEHISNLDAKTIQNKLFCSQLQNKLFYSYLYLR